MPSNHLILCHPLLLLPPNPPSIRVFSNESARRVRWAKYWSFSFSPSSECSALISFRMDWLDLLAVQGTLKNLLQHHSSLALSFLYSPLSHLYHGYRLLFKNCDNIHIQFMVLAIFKGTVQGREVHSSRAAIATVHPQDCLIFPHPVPTKPQSLPVPPNPAPGSQTAIELSNHEFDLFRLSKPTVAVLLRLVYFALHSVLEVSPVLYHVSESPPF